MINSSCRTGESESRIRDYESVFIIPGTSVDTNRKRQSNAIPLQSAIRKLCKTKTRANRCCFLFSTSYPIYIYIYIKIEHERSHEIVESALQTSCRVQKYCNKLRLVTILRKKLASSYLPINTQYPWTYVCFICSWNGDRSLGSVFLCRCIRSVVFLFVLHVYLYNCFQIIKFRIRH